MPFKRNSDLPKAVRKLPERLQTIWRKTWNSIDEQLRRKGVPKKERERRAAAGAWSAVNKARDKQQDNTYIPEYVWDFFEKHDFMPHERLWRFLSED